MAVSRGSTVAAIVSTRAARSRRRCDKAGGLASDGLPPSATARLGPGSADSATTLAGRSRSRANIVREGRFREGDLGQDCWRCCGRRSHGLLAFYGRSRFVITGAFFFLLFLGLEWDGDCTLSQISADFVQVQGSSWATVQIRDIAESNCIYSIGGMIG